MFASTTNPPVATGDGVALALRAGAEVTDLEFVQFHPTVLWLGPGAAGQQPLISEAVRGEGAILVDVRGNRFMVGQHPLAELAPRYVVAQAIVRQLRETGADHVLLDARGVPDFAERFPTITASCRANGIDPVTMPIPVVPGAHHASGGVRTDLFGRSNVPGLYACGEVACTGVHGANRLASNSLLEGLVFAARIAEDLAVSLPPAGIPAIDQRDAGLLPSAALIGVQAAMTAGAGVLRSADEPRRDGGFVGDHQRASGGRRARGRAVRRKHGRRPTCTRSRALLSPARNAGPRPVAATGARITPRRQRRGAGIS